MCGRCAAATAADVLDGERGEDKVLLLLFLG
jgi:hypothetical protein